MTEKGSHPDASRSTQPTKPHLTHTGPQARLLPPRGLTACAAWLPCHPSNALFALTPRAVVPPSYLRTTQVVYRLLLDLGAVVRDHAPRAPAAVAALLQRRRAPRLHVLPLEALAPPTAPTEPQPPTPPSRRAAAAQSASMLQLLRLDSNAASATAAAGGNPPATPTAAAAAGPSSSSLPKAASLSTASQMELSLSSFNLNASTSPSVGRLASPSGQDLAAQGAGGGPGMPTAAAAAGGGGGSASSGQGWSPLPVMLSGVVAPNAIVSKLMLVQLLQGLVAVSVLVCIRLGFAPGAGQTLPGLRRIR